MKYKILGWVGVIWGGLILLSGLVKVLTAGVSDGAYGAGQLGAYALGGLLVFAGVSALRKKP